MISNILQKARDYENEAAQNLKDIARPRYHFSCPVGWLNDPNGFSFYGGKYHLFYQYYPYDTKWGPMHWGHATSSNLLNWENLPCALSPDTNADMGGCFSGSAIQTPDGKQLLIYTGVNLVKTFVENGAKNKVPVDKYIQTQCIATGNGLNYQKYEGNPIATAKNISDKSNEYEFRDPKIWRDNDGTYYFVAVNCDKSNNFNDGRIVIFKSSDALNWEFSHVLLQNNGRFGRMWECPDFFTLGDKSVILVSPMDMLQKDEDYYNGNGVICLIGHIKDDTGEFIIENAQSVDSGIDFYATQTTLAPDGRRLMTAWMQNWDTSASNTYNATRAWIGQMITARELTIKDNHLYQTPIKELEQLHRDKIEYKDLKITGTQSLKNIDGRYIDLTITIKNASDPNIYKSFEIALAKNNDYYTTVTFTPFNKLVTLDRRYSGTRRAIIHQRSCKVNNSNGEIKIRILLDAFSIEVFINDGYKTMTALLDTPLNANEITFFCDGSAIIDLQKYNIVC